MVAATVGQATMRAAMTSKWWPFPIAVCGLVAVLAAQRSQSDDPQRQRLAVVHQTIVDQLERARTVGIVALVEIDGKMVFSATAGMRDREKRAPMGRDAIFRIQAMARPVTSVAALILCDEGRLHLDDPVSKYLPELAGLQVARHGDTPVPAEREITVRDLLRQTSGLHPPRPFDVTAATTTRWSDLPGLIHVLGTMPLAFQPGRRWEYGVSTDVLGRVIEVASGRALADFLRERVLEPLDMRDTGFNVREEDLDRLCKTYTRGADGKAWNARSEGNPRKVPRFLGGSGGMYSTARDYLKFARMLLAGGRGPEGALLEPETAASMMQDQLGDAAGTRVLGGNGFGLGVAVVKERGAQEPGPSAGTVFWGGGSGTLCWIDPARHLIGIYMTQTRAQPGLAAEFQAAVYRALAQE
jgi:CubicO group peptidase (beta-lactamase class C family)